MSIIFSILFAISGVVAGWASRAPRIKPVAIGLVAVLILGCVLFVVGLRSPAETLRDPNDISTLFFAGMICILLGACLGIALVLGRLLRGRASIYSAGLLGGIGAIFVTLGLFYLATNGGV